MSKRNHRSKKRDFLSGPWKKIHGGIWIMGLALIAYNNWWWPGILVLLGASSIVEGLAEVVYSEFLRDQEEASEQSNEASH